MTKITLWMPTPRPPFAVYDEDGSLREMGPTLSESDVFCDCCNADITIRPAPVLAGYALCLECLTKVAPDWRSRISPKIQESWRQQARRQASE